MLKVQIRHGWGGWVNKGGGRKRAKKKVEQCAEGEEARYREEGRGI